MVKIIIPAFNEEKSIGKVIAAIPTNIGVSEIIVANNASTDCTAEVAKDAGATVVLAKQKGYGYACLQAMEYIQNQSQKPQIIVFLDGDFSDYPEEMPLLLRPILEEGYDLVIGSRTLGKKEKGSLTPQQLFGNWLATTLMRWIYKTQFTDLGPFRAIRYEKLLAIKMQDKTYGWTVEMQIKAAKLGLKCTEVPVNYRVRIGKSKVSGTIKGTIMAGYKILWTIFEHSLF